MIDIYNTNFFLSALNITAAPKIGNSFNTNPVIMANVDNIYDLRIVSAEIDAKKNINRSIFPRSTPNKTAGDNTAENTIAITLLFAFGRIRQIPTINEKITISPRIVVWVWFIPRKYRFCQILG